MSKLIFTLNCDWIEEKKKEYGNSIRKMERVGRAFGDAKDQAEAKPQERSLAEILAAGLEAAREEEPATEEEVEAMFEELQRRVDAAEEDE